MKDKYYDQAAACVKDYVLPAQLKLYQSCDGDLDRVYGEAICWHAISCLKIFISMQWILSGIPGKVRKLAFLPLAMIMENRQGK